MSNGRELIVRKSHVLNKPDLGVVDIVFVSSDSDKCVEIPSEEEFPTKGIFISKGFDEVNKKFNPGELFRLLNWDKSEEGNSDFMSERHPHWAFGSSVKSIEASAFIPIFNGALPDVSTGNSDIRGLPTNKAFFIRDAGEIYGPFMASARTADEGVKVSPSSQPILSISNHYILKLSEKILKDEGVITPHLNEDEFQYIVSLRAIPKEAKNEVDFISDEQLITYFAKSKFGKKTILSKKETEKLKNGINECIKKGELTKGYRVIRLNEILDKYLEADSGDELVNDYLNGERGKEFLSRYVESKPVSQ